MISFFTQVQNYALWLLGLMIIIQCLIIGLDRETFPKQRSEVIFAAALMLALILAAFTLKNTVGTFFAAVLTITGFLRMQYLLGASRVVSYRILCHSLFFIIMIILVAMITKTIFIEQEITKIAQ